MVLGLSAFIANLANPVLGPMCRVPIDVDRLCHDFAITLNGADVRTKHDELVLLVMGLIDEVVSTSAPLSFF